MTALDALIDEIVNRRTLGDTFCLYPLLYHLLLAPADMPAQQRPWCLKDNTWQGAHELKQALPRLKLVVVMRDPRSVALSMAKASARETGRPPGTAELVRAGFDWLTNSVHFADLLDTYGGDAHLIRYEDFVTAPADTLNAAWRALGLAPLDAATVADQLETLFYKPTVGHTIENPDNKSAERVAEQFTENAGVSARALNRWRHELSPDQQDIIALIAGRTAQRFGYDLAPPAPDHGAIWLLGQVSGARNRLQSGVRYALHRATGLPPSRAGIARLVRSRLFGAGTA